MSDRFYPINSLSDILSKFRAELNIALEEVNKRIDELEARILQGNITTTEGEREVETEEGEDRTYRALSTIAAIGAARRALYGYAMLADSLGLPKDMREQVRQLEAMTSAAMRLMQTIKLLEYAQAAFEAGTPMGWLLLALAGGTAAATIVYTARSGGG